MYAIHCFKVIMVSHSSHMAIASVSEAALGAGLDTKDNGVCTTGDFAGSFPLISPEADAVGLQVWNQLLSVGE